MADRGLHGTATDSSFLQALLDVGNRLRYGKGEEERMDMVNRLQAPGVEESAYQGPNKVYDPAAAERYTSAYLFANKWPSLVEPAQGATAFFRGAGAKMGIPGMGPERSELVEAMRRGMARGRSMRLQKPGKLGRLR